MMTVDLPQTIFFFVMLGLCSSTIIIFAISALCAVIRALLNLMGRR